MGKGFIKGRKNAIKHNSKNKIGRLSGYHLSTATRALMIGVAVIIVCIVCSLALYMSKQGKTAINSGTSQYNKMLEDYQDLDIAMYDGLMVSGQEVTALIRKWESQKNTVAVRVKTKAAGFVFYNNYYDENMESQGEKDTVPTDAPENVENSENSVKKPESFVNKLTEDKNDKNYINPQADFLGTVWKNANGAIVCIDFVQQ